MSYVIVYPNGDFTIVDSRIEADKAIEQGHAVAYYDAIGLEWAQRVAAAKAEQQTA